MDFEPLDQYLQRRKKLSEINSLGHPSYPHRFDWSHSIPEVVNRYGDVATDALAAEPITVQVAGRVVALRPHGKASFAHLLGDGSRLQILVKLDLVGEAAYKLFQLLDLGDIIGVSGRLIRTRTNELTIAVDKIELLNKSLLPLPEKWHGLADIEQRYRRRYLDLIGNEGVRDIFVRRTQITRELRRFFDERGYLEVETPMMHPILGGATARPFIAHHNTFDMDLYLRIAPELYLKRLVVGGFDRVYEINRNFRNEGIDATHQPEFTMLEFYQAYSDYSDLMKLTEELFAGLVQKVRGTTTVKYGDVELDFSKFQRLSMRGAIQKYWPEQAGGPPSDGELAARGGPRSTAERYNIYAKSQQKDQIGHSGVVDPAASDGELIGELFEAIAEAHLIQPTFIYDFPSAISPLSKSRAEDPSIAERFELFVAGMELANGFSELNDPDLQESRFRAQVEKGGHESPKEVDTDYIRALCHGLPPTAGEGIGIDRLVMLLTDSHSIREVVLFPLLRAETNESETPISAEASAGEGYKG